MTTETAAVKKRQGPIRWNAVIPFLIFCVLIFVYFHFFFDHNLRKGLEWAGYKGIGAEVNIAKLETSFWNATLRVQKIEVTNSDSPSQNSIEIGDIRFGMSWDALLRAKILVNEAVIENIQFGTARKRPGRVAPPEPAKAGPGLAENLKEQALAATQQKYADNMLGDLAAILGGTDAQAQLGKIEATLASKQKAQQMEAEIKAKQKYWDEKLKSLPQGKDLQALNDRLNKVKYKDFKTPQELQTSLQELDAIVKQGEAYQKQIGSTGQELERDLKKVDSDVRELDAMIKSDIKALETRFRIPSINTKDLTRALFNKYLGKYMDKIHRYRAMAEKYLPPKIVSKIKGAPEDGADVAVQPHPREKGIVYEFGRQNSYPLVWIKRAAISSEAGMSPKAGNIRGEIRDITTHQTLTGRPTVATINGDFPADKITGVLIKVSLDNTKAESLIGYEVGVGGYPINATELVSSPDVKIALKDAIGKLYISGELRALRDFKMNLSNQFTTANFDVSAKDGTVDSILKGVFAGLPVITLSGSAYGLLPAISFDVSSNLGSELEKGLRKQVEAKIAEARKQIEAFVAKEVQKNRAEIEKQVNALRGQLENEVKKVQAQIETQKKQVEAKADQAKKDAESQAKKRVTEEGQKAVDDLKKKFGF